MKIEEQCVSLDLAKRLKELGVEQESALYYCPGEHAVSAFTVAELGTLLIYNPEWWPTDGGPTEADFRAKLLIERIESGAIRFDGEKEKKA